jgi:predicted ribosome quality control (RQC) complex YloA/Tae2 family protein
MLTANNNVPRLGFTAKSKKSPLQAPMFCMVLRKHLSGGRILEITQPDFERIVEIRIETLDEMGDRAEKILLIEIMGKHSNIMLISGEKIIDAIKHIPPSVSMARPVLPGATYSRPPSQNKQNPLITAKNADIFFTAIESVNENIERKIYKSHSGISPRLAIEICNRAGIDPEAIHLCDAEKTQLHATFFSIFNKVAAENFKCAIYRNEAGKAVDLAVLPFSIYANYSAEAFDSPSEMLEAFYSQRDEAYRISQKTADLRKIITIHQERCRKKTFVYEKTLEETKNRDELRIKGELLTAFLYAIKQGAESFTAENFYNNNEPLEISLDPTLTAAENAQKYFRKYNKQKRAFTALQELISNNAEELAYLEDVAFSAENATSEADIAEIRAELAEQGFVKNKYRTKKVVAAKPLKYTSSDGFEIYVGKNSTQNDLLTMKMAKPRDIWFHTKGFAGSHVILVTNGKEPSETAIREAANLAALNSRARHGSQVPVDYVARKHVRKPTGAKPGFVIYDSHKTIYVTPVGI